MMVKISGFREAEMTSDNVDNCFYVENLNTPDMRVVKMSNVFKWIKEAAIKEGLTVEMKGEQIIFIKR